MLIHHACLFNQLADRAILAAFRWVFHSNRFFTADIGQAQKWLNHKVVEPQSG